MIVATDRAHSEEMLAALLASIPFGADESFRAIQLSTGGPAIAAAFLQRFPRARLLVLEASEDARRELATMLQPFGDRADVRPFELATLDWWDLMRGADVVIAVLAVHTLNDAKKQYLYTAAAARLTGRGALLIADSPHGTCIQRLSFLIWNLCLYVPGSTHTLLFCRELCSLGTDRGRLLPASLAECGLAF